MAKTDLSSLDDSIKLLSNYHDRLEEEIITISKKLQIPNAKINSTLEENVELNKLKKTLGELIVYRDNQISHKKENFMQT